MNTKQTLHFKVTVFHAANGKQKRRNQNSVNKCLGDKIPEMIRNWFVDLFPD